MSCDPLSFTKAIYVTVDFGNLTSESQTEDTEDNDSLIPGICQ